MAGQFWKTYPIDIEVKVCRVHYTRIKNLITGGILDDEKDRCWVKRCHEKTYGIFTIRVQQGEENPAERRTD